MFVAPLSVVFVALFNALSLAAAVKRVNVTRDTRYDFPSNSNNADDTNNGCSGSDMTS
ncbi:uncharacterized protein BXZ73DRAFT_99989 [Epithele typhae]|uniref:uncharacterized protein n=1 Tax=Epithele typhae TaxID=378194 RepID=UPI00200865FD|nr:uncharacterized protein BXZ73DRAFT_99989 [Epithele typhae]KAH9937768.1 hypothetical protein BXZ73DRAFT_99989 [Epithele typhae]